MFVLELTGANSVHAHDIRCVDKNGYLAWHICKVAVAILLQTKSLTKRVFQVK